MVEVKAHMTAHLSAYKVNEVAVSLWALSRLKGQPGGRLMAAALQHCFSQVRTAPHHSKAHHTTARHDPIEAATSTVMFGCMHILTGL